MMIDSDILFPSDRKTKKIAQSLYKITGNLPIVSPHGHCEASWFSKNESFTNPSELLIVPDHYIFRMLVSQGISLESLGIPTHDGSSFERDPVKIWKIFADHYYLFRGTPTAMWLDYTFKHVFEISEPLNSSNSLTFYNHILAKLQEPSFKPRILFDRFNIETLATTDSAIDDLKNHKFIIDSNWNGNIIPTYRPDNIIDPETKEFSYNLKLLGEMTKEDISTWKGYLAAHASRRDFFIKHGAKATDHGHFTPKTYNLSEEETSNLYEKIYTGNFSQSDSAIFRGQMITEMAKMSIDDGLVMQLHTGSKRNHSSLIYNRFGADKGFDIPTSMDYVTGLKPLLEAVGLSNKITIIIFTLDESSYSRELAPLAGVYPALKLGPPWWFFDNFEGMKRFRETTTETCGFYNTVGFNDDTRAFCSIPARHDFSRRCDCSYLAHLVTTGRLRINEAEDLAEDLAYNLCKRAYKI